MVYSEAIRFLYELRMFGAKLGLENPRKLAALAGDPQKQLRFIHVAGTNGKGSTCAMLESIYRQAGLRVGLFTSPHLVAFGERIQVNRQPITEEDIVRLVAQMRELLKEFSTAAHPTFFEVITIMALRYFAEQQCELVIWETGLGGRLDATNIVEPLASVITNIQFDHEKWLGETLPQIAFEKAGIIKPGVPIVTSEDKLEALQVIAETAQRNQARLLQVTWKDVQRPPLKELDLPLHGAHQRLNAALAVETVRALGEQIPVNTSAIRDGLLQTHWPGRLQIISVGAGRTIVLDGAHNPAGVETLRAALQHYFPSRAATLIFGVLRDKDFTAMCRALATFAGRVLLPPVSSDRAADAEILNDVFRQFAPNISTQTCSSMAEAFHLASDDPLVVVTGSLHFVGEAMEVLRISPATIQDERGLNDWTAVAGPTP